MKAVSWNADLAIMDEPTTSLTNNEKEGLFQIIGRLKGDGQEYHIHHPYTGGGVPVPAAAPAS